MSRALHITMLVENTASGRGLLGEHGLAFWIKTHSARILLDTGQGMVLEHNARHLGIALESADAIVLSHGHYDHTGGLAQAAAAAPRARVFAHPAAFQAKFHCNDDGTARSIGVPRLDESPVRAPADRLVPTNGPTEIGDGVFVTGQVPRTTAFEDTGGRFFLDEGCQQPDGLIDDQAVFLEAAAGTVVLLGCAHAGVINTLRYIRKLTGNRRVHSVIGGMHLSDASAQRLDRTVESLRQFDITRLAPVHCTGMVAAARLWTEFPGRCLRCTVGTALHIEGP